MTKINSITKSLELWSNLRVKVSDLKKMLMIFNNIELLSYDFLVDIDEET